MRTQDDIYKYKIYLKQQINKMEEKEYGQGNRSLLETYKVKLETLNYLTREDKDKPDRLSLCKWLAG